MTIKINSMEKTPTNHSSALLGIYAHFRHVIPKDEVSLESIQPFIEKSRKLEKILRWIYDIIFKGGYQAYGVPEKLMKEAIEFFIETYSGEPVPGWAHDCLHLGSLVPAIDNIEIVMQPITDDHRVTLYLRSTEDPAITSNISHD